MTSLQAGALPRHCIHAMHSFIVESAMSQPDPRLAELMLLRFPSGRHVMQELEAGTIRTSILMDRSDDGDVYVRLEMLGEDDRWHGITHPPVRFIGLDPAETAALAVAETYLRGEEPKRMTPDDLEPQDN